MSSPAESDLQTITLVKAFPKLQSLNTHWIIHSGEIQKDKKSELLVKIDYLQGNISIL